MNFYFLLLAVIALTVFGYGIRADQNPDPIRYRKHSWKLNTWVERDEPLQKGDKYWDPDTGDLVQIGGLPGMDIPDLPPIEEGPAVDEGEQQELWKPPSAPAEEPTNTEEIDEGGSSITDLRQGGATTPDGPGGTGQTTQDTGGVEPRIDTTQGPGVKDTPDSDDIFKSDLAQPPVDDNLTAAAGREFGQEPSLGAAGKRAMSRTAAGDIDVSELRKRVRTQQAAGGLAYGGAAAKQEARIVGRYKQGKQLKAATQLADFTQQESQLEQNIAGFLASTEAATTKAATSQLMTPIRAHGSLVQGSQAGLASIFGLGRLL